MPPEATGPEHVRRLIAVAAPPDWRDSLILNDRKTPRALLANAVIAVRHAPEWAGILWFDAFRQKVTLRGRAPWMDAAGDEAWTSVHDMRAADWLQHRGICVSTEVAGHAVEMVARERWFHPVREYLGRCRWDGKPRLDRWAVEYLGAEDTPYVQAVGARWMISAVARITEPGCKADCALILEGRQGLLKSTALKTLAQPWFTDEVADLGTKDAALQLAGVWILELAELDSMNRGEVSKIKAFMSRTTDRFRPPYERRVVEVPRQCVFAGTVNLNEYLRDETGGRRFWPIGCTKIDIAGLAAVRDQLWAEARDRYLAGEAWWLNTVDLNRDATDEQRGRYQADPWEKPIRETLIGQSFVTVNEILRDVIKLPIERQGQAEMNRAARCLRAIGWERQQYRRDDGSRDWRYRPKLSPVSPVGEK